MKIFVISLRRSADRRATVARQMAGAGVAFEFFDAVDGGTDGSSHFGGCDQFLYRLNTRRQPLPGEIGCYASHLALWRLCVESDESFIILEDDFRLTADFPAAVAELPRLLPRFKFIRLEALKRPARPCRFRVRPPHHLVAHSGRFGVHYLSDVPLCTLAYAVSPVAASALITHSATLTSPVDKFLQRTWEHGIPVFGLTPTTVMASEHAITSTIGKRKVKSWNPALLLARLTYKAGGRLRRYRFDAIRLRELGLPTSPAPRRREVAAARVSIVTSDRSFKATTPSVRRE